MRREINEYHFVAQQGALAPTIGSFFVKVASDYDDCIHVLARQYAMGSGMSGQSVHAAILRMERTDEALAVGRGDDLGIKQHRQLQNSTGGMACAGTENKDNIARAVEYPMKSIYSLAIDRI